MAKKMGRPSTYTPEIAAEICSLVAGGSNLSRICGKDGMPTRDAVYHWLREHRDFADDYARAREDRGDGRNDQIDALQRQLDEIVTDLRTDKAKIEAPAAHAAVGAIRAQIDTLKWQAAHEAPKGYGDRLELAGDKDAPLVVSVAETLRRRREKREAKAE